MSEPKNDSLDTRIALLERDVSNITLFFDRLDSAMEKLTDISSSVKEMLAVHELRINKQENANHALTDLVEARRVQTENAHKAIEKKVEDTEQNIRKDIDFLREDFRKYHDDSAKTKNIVERYKWFFIATGMMIGFILYKLGIIPFMSFSL
jgi:serine/threonine-protein kinase RIO1